MFQFFASRAAAFAHIATEIGQFVVTPREAVEFAEDNVSLIEEWMVDSEELFMVDQTALRKKRSLYLAKAAL